MLSLADRVSVIVFAFDSGDDRRELIRTLARDVEAAEKRLALLEAFLESRGLPKGWEGPLDAWCWVVVDLQSRDILGVEFGAEMPSVWGLPDGVAYRAQARFPDREVGMDRWDDTNTEQRTKVEATLRE